MSFGFGIPQVAATKGSSSYATISTGTPNAIAAGLELLRDSRYSDLVIRAAAREWHVHRAIVCGRCPFFAACVKHQFKESENNAINLPEDQPDYVELLLRYIYTYDIDTAMQIIPEPVRKTDATCLAVFALADKYDLQNLKDHFRAVLEQRATDFETLLRRTPEIGSNFSSRIQSDFDQALIFLVIVTECETPGLDKVKKTTIRAIGTSAQYIELWNTKISSGRMQDLYTAHPEIGIDLIMTLSDLYMNGAVRSLLNHKCMVEAISEQPDVMAELMHSLVPGRYPTSSKTFSW